MEETAANKDRGSKLTLLVYEQNHNQHDLSLYQHLLLA